MCYCNKLREYVAASDGDPLQQVAGGAAWRFLEQQPEEPTLRQSRQEQRKEPQQQQRVSYCPHACKPEPNVLRDFRECLKRPRTVMTRPLLRPSCLRLQGWSQDLTAFVLWLISAVMCFPRNQNSLVPTSYIRLAVGLQIVYNTGY